ncbi:hypothetical protein HXX76_011610 [Chlamydomonas incerta]|uniref:Uncharacterized protein n=1 Tax=Chlamydomonas incerta TaxID=51695 RepID=A0A835SRR1_CHLIN|nr:hypothetical protein HXX76_011610 [Chlamydomonas incerta]|eukprot:KAG2428493.1 hypothetical protein HXX76_011610 [Chlamydomonas incerta]
MPSPVAPPRRCVARVPSGLVARPARSLVAARAWRWCRDKPAAATTPSNSGYPDWSRINALGLTVVGTALAVITVLLACIADFKADLRADIAAIREQKLAQLVPACNEEVVIDPAGPGLTARRRCHAHWVLTPSRPGVTAVRYPEE